jgi:hypothetical protein
VIRGEFALRQAGKPPLVPKRGPQPPSPDSKAPPSS